MHLNQSSLGQAVFKVAACFMDFCPDAKVKTSSTLLDCRVNHSPVKLTRCTDVVVTR